MICQSLVDLQSGVVQMEAPQPSAGYAQRTPSMEPMYATPATTAGDDIATNWPSWACQSSCKDGTVEGDSVVYEIDMTGTTDKSALIVRCDAQGAVWVSISSKPAVKPRRM